jgi:NitT/TauT family transport system ATP-binding protein
MMAASGRDTAQTRGSGPAIALREVAKQFDTPDGPVHALAPTNFAVRKGEFAVLLGPSGCGKTTMLRMIAGLEQPSGGWVEIDGLNLWNGAERDGATLAHLGMVFQEANLFPWLSVLDNIALPLKLRGTPRGERRDRARELCRVVGIAGFENRYPRELSGGMRQRASIARALSYNPDILLMDEPFGALDAITRESMNQELQRLWMETHKTIVLVTHSISEAVFLADRVVLLSPRPGRIQEVVPVDFPRPRDSALQSEAAFQSIVAHLRSRLEH